MYARKEQKSTPTANFSPLSIVRMVYEVTFALHAANGTPAFYRGLASCILRIPGRGYLFINPTVKQSLTVATSHKGRHCAEYNLTD